MCNTKFQKCYPIKSGLLMDVKTFVPLWKCLELPWRKMKATEFFLGTGLICLIPCRLLVIYTTRHLIVSASPLHTSFYLWAPPSAHQGCLRTFDKFQWCANYNSFASCATSSHLSSQNPKTNTKGSLSHCTSRDLMCGYSERHWICVKEMFSHLFVFETGSPWQLKVTWNLKLPL